MLSSILSPAGADLELLRQDGTTAPASSALRGAPFLLLFFSASWCPPCRLFTPQLAAFHAAFRDACGFEVLFVSRDRDERSMRAYFHNPRHSRLAVRGGEGSHGDWLAVPFERAQALGEALVRRYGVAGIPTVLIFRTETGALVTREGRQMIALHAHTAEGFPWEGVQTTGATAAPGLCQIAVLVVIIYVLYLFYPL